jgi:hypothetical protein
MLHFTVHKDFKTLYLKKTAIVIGIKFSKTAKTPSSSILQFNTQKIYNNVKIC